MTQSTPLAAVLPAAARWGWGRYLHSLSRCQGDVAGIDTIRTRRLLPTDSGRSGFVPWSGRDGLPNRRAGIFATSFGGRPRLSLRHQPRKHLAQYNTDGLKASCDSSLVHEREHGGCFVPNPGKVFTFAGKADARRS